MGPKKGSKKQNDDWETELGESLLPTNGQTDKATNDAAPMEDEDMGGGLLAALKKNKNKKGKKGKPVNNDSVEGESVPGVKPANNDQEDDIDEEDVFAGGKKAKEEAAQVVAKAAAAKEAGVADTDASGRMKSKKEKEKEKKEKEKERKREQV